METQSFRVNGPLRVTSCCPLNWYFGIMNSTFSEMCCPNCFKLSLILGCGRPFWHAHPFCNVARSVLYKFWCQHSRTWIIWPSLYRTSRIIRTIIIHTIVFFPIDTIDFMDYSHILLNSHKNFAYFLCEISGLHCMKHTKNIMSVQIYLFMKGFLIMYNCQQLSQTNNVQK